MLARCYNPKNISYPNYGAKGISVCSEWRNSFWKFVEDVGDKPFKGASIDRVDVNGNYCKENIKWSSVKDQSRNKTCTIYIYCDDKKMPLVEWCENTNESYQSCRQRLRGGRFYTYAKLKHGEEWFHVKL
jgi:hypothetical protein